MRMLVVAAAVLIPWAACSAQEEEIRDRYMLVMQDRGGLAPGTRPACFAAWKTQVTEAYYKTCPWDVPPPVRTRPLRVR